MAKVSKKQTLRLVGIATSIALLSAVAIQGAEAAPTASQQVATTSTVTFKNTFYRFSVTLPATWKGYKIVTTKWLGYNDSSQHAVTSGPLISIRNPLWTAKKPRQDIPVMVFTLHKWNALVKENFHIGAAPIGPSELGRNDAYVFALPARYNFAFLPGYKEVEKILAGKPLKTFAKVDSGKL
ncbi:MAG: hypothetical protein WDO06_08255 [Actinomycetota bacterium]